MLWHCWLGSRKGIRPVKIWVVGCWLSYLSGATSEVQTCIWPSWCHCHSLSLASVKSRLVLPFWYWLTRVVPDKGPLNGYVCLSFVSYHYYHLPSVLWRYWLGSRKGIWPVANWVMGCWHSYLSGARCRLAYVSADPTATATHCLLLH